MDRRRIWFRNEAFPLSHYFSFISTHIKYLSVDEMLERPISLYTISPRRKAAYFVELPDGGDPYDTKKYPFLFHVQKGASKFLYVIPLDDFYRYTDSLNVSSRRIVWCHYSLRCGSTVWCQMFNDLPGWSVISESGYMNYNLLERDPSENFAAYTNSDEFSKMAVNGFKFNVSRFPKEHSLFVKTQVLDINMLLHISKHFDRLTVVHTYRDVLPSAKSWYNTIIESRVPAEALYLVKKSRFIPMDRLLKDWLNIFTQAWPATIKQMPFVEPQNSFEAFTMIWCSANDAIRKAQECGLAIHCVKYERLMENQQAMIRKVFEVIDIPEKLIEAALEALERDSQASSPYSHEQQKKNSKWNQSIESVQRCDQILNLMEFPNLGEDFTLPHTL